MKKKDMKILSSLRNDARQTLTNISKKTRIPVSTIYDKLKAYEGNLIKKYTTLLDFNLLGFNTRANMAIKVNKEERKLVKEFLLKHCSINSVYKINNGFDFLVEVVFRNIKDMEDFTESLEEKFKIESIQIFYVIEDVKREGFLSNLELAELV